MNRYFLFWKVPPPLCDKAMNNDPLGLKGALKTFGPIKYGTPKKPTYKKRPVSDREPMRLTEDNWFFLTGTFYKAPLLHNHSPTCSCYADKCKGCKEKK